MELPPQTLPRSGHNWEEGPRTFVPFQPGGFLLSVTPTMPGQDRMGGGEQHSGDGPLPALGLSLCKCSPCGLPRQGTRAVSTPSRIASPMAIATGQPSQQPAGTAWPGRPTVSTPCGPMAITASVHLYLPQVSPFYMLTFLEHLRRPNPVLGALCMLSHSFGTAL